MEEKAKQPKPISTATITFAIATIILGGLSGYLAYKNTELEKDKGETVEEISSDNYHIKKVGDEIYYVIDDDYDGDYDIQYTDLSDEEDDDDDDEGGLIIYDKEKTVTEDEIRNNRVEIRNSCKNTDDFKVRKIMSYNDYAAYTEKVGIEKVYNQKYRNYAVFSYYANGASDIEARLAEVEEWGSGLTFYVWDKAENYSGDCAAYVIIVPTYHSIGFDINVVPLNDEDNLEVPVHPRPVDPDDPIYTVDKPMIYLYPEREQSVEVKLDSPEKLTVSYPAYVDSWNVVAKPDGTLKDKNGRELYGLYYESLPKTEFKVENEGFIVKKEDSTKFLEEKLAKLGLNEKEAEEFIVYWLPKMNEKKYNYVRFASSEEIENNMKLSISPKPDTIIRIWIVLKPLDEKIEVTEQKINPVTRSGFTAVEWGGIKL